MDDKFKDHLGKHLANTLTLIYHKKENNDQDVNEFAKLYLEPIIKTKTYILKDIIEDIEYGRTKDYIRGLYVEKCCSCNVTEATKEIINNKRDELVEYVTQVWNTILLLNDNNR